MLCFNFNMEEWENSLSNRIQQYRQTHHDERGKSEQLSGT